MASSDCRHLGNRDIATFPIALDRLTAKQRKELGSLGQALVKDLKANAEHTVRRYKDSFDVECLSFRVKDSKSIIDEIDRSLGDLYGLDAEELDFITNYDIKFRVGAKDD